MQNNEYHNSTGPAMIFNDQYKEYWMYGFPIPKEDLGAPISYLKLKYDDVDINETNIWI